VNEAALVAFNLLVNGIGSFAVGVLIATLAARWLRASPGRATVWLATLPFLKMVLDASRGVPEGSFLWLRAQGATQDLGSFRVGVGLERVIPKIDMSLGALYRGASYTQSGADLLASGLLKHVGVWAPGAGAAVLLGGSIYRLAHRAIEVRRASALRRRVEAVAALEVRRVGRRSVPIHVVPGLDGSAFTGGIVRPFIAFPEPLWRALTEPEREAAIQHELAHVAELHVPWTVATGLVCDVFWFVPFIRRFHDRLVAACEIAADAIATRRGADPIALASALVRTRELARAGRLAPAMVLGAARGALGQRVEHLMRPRPPARFPRGRIVGRAILVAWSAAAVMLSIPLGNH
jgi:Zn-dependent protease with chaperone function